MSERDEIEELLKRSGGMNLGEIFVSIIKQTCDLGSAIPKVNGQLPFWLFQNKDDNHSGSLILRTLHSGGIKLELYADALEDLTDGKKYVAPDPLLEISVGTKGAHKTGREALELNFPRPLLIPSTSSDWVLKVARQCSTLSAEHIRSAYSNEE